MPADALLQPLALVYLNSMLRSWVKAAVGKHPDLMRPLWRLAYPWIYPFRKNGRYAGDEYVGGRAAAFTTIFRENRWGDKESVSGPGSSRAATNMLQRVLDQVLARTGARTILDAPCGDLNWMRHIALPRGTRYIGADIVPELIEALRGSNEADDRRFMVLDIVSEPLPAADLWLCRHVLMHLSNDEVRQVLENFAQSEIRYLLVDSHSFVRKNSDIRSGGWRHINLRRGPFNLPKPLATYPNSNPPSAPDDLYLWDRGQIRSALAR